MRVLGVDLGTRRIGIATSDSRGRLASAHPYVARGADPAEDYENLARLVRETGAHKVIVGLPLGLDGRVGAAAEAALAEVEAMSGVVGVPVETHDERLTTVSAERSLRSTGARAEKRRQLVDSTAAAVMLQSWLDAQRGGPSDPAEERKGI